LLFRVCDREADFSGLLIEQEIFIHIDVFIILSQDCDTYTSIKRVRIGALSEESGHSILHPYLLRGGDWVVGLSLCKLSALRSCVVAGRERD
jgi:hypothetical protein